PATCLCSSVTVLREVEVHQRALFEPVLVRLFLKPARIGSRLSHLDEQPAGRGVGDRRARLTARARLVSEAALDADRVAGPQLLHVQLGQVFRLVAAAARSALAVLVAALLHW